MVNFRLFNVDLKIFLKDTLGTSKARDHIKEQLPTREKEHETKLRGRTLSKSLTYLLMSFFTWYNGWIIELKGM